MAIISKSWLLKHFFESENQQKIKFYIMEFIVFLFFLNSEYHLSLFDRYVIFVKNLSEKTKIITCNGSFYI